MNQVTPRASQLEIRRRLQTHRLRPTRQRMALATLLFADGDRHTSAERLHEEAVAKAVPVSLATVYNTLRQFKAAGLLREVMVDGSKSYFDTNSSDHHHFFIEDEEIIIDVPGERLALGRVPEPPPGYEITRVDVVVRLRRVGG
jgi:Fur family iron response transcriptional regulator